MTARSAPASTRRADLEAWLRFLRLEGHHLRKWPAVLYQQAFNQPDGSAPATAARERLATRLARPWLRWINKPQEADPCLLTLAGHRMSVAAAVYAGDGRTIASLSDWDVSIRLWDVSTGEELRVIERAAGSLMGLFAWSPEGRRFACGSTEAGVAVHLLDAVSGAVLARLPGTLRELQSCAFSPDGERLATGSSTRGMTQTDAGWRDLPAQLKLWSTDTGALLGLVGTHKGLIGACAYSPDGSRIAAGDSTGALKVWHARAFAFPEGDEEAQCAFLDASNLVTTCAGHEADVRACAFSRDGRQIASVSADRTVRLWNADTGALLQTLRGHTADVWACAVSPDGERVVSGSGCKDDRHAGELRIWDAGTGEPLATIVGHTGPVRACAYSPDGSRIVSASEDKTLKVWDAALAERYRPSSNTFPKRCPAVAISPDGATLAAATAEGPIALCDLDTGTERARLAGHSARVQSCRFSPDGARIASGSADGTLRLWHAASAQELRVLARHTAINACAFAPDGRLVASGSVDRTLKLWDAATGEELAFLAGRLRGLEGLPAPGHSEEIRACAFSTDGRRLLSASADRTLKLWDVDTGDEIRTLQGHAMGVDACVFSPDGRRIASTGSAGLARPGQVKTWTSDGEPLASFAGHEDSVNNCVFSADGRWLISTSEDRTIRIWDAATAKPAGVFPVAQPITGLAVGPRGVLVAAGPESERTYVLEVMGLEAPLATGVYLYDFERGEYAAEPRCLCGHCGRWVRLPAMTSTPATMVAALDDRHGPQSAGSLARCPECAGSLRVSPVIVDRRTPPRPKRPAQESGIRVFAGHTDRINDCAFWPDGRHVATASEDSTVKVWNCETGKVLVTTVGPRTGVAYCTVSPDGFWLLAATKARTTVCWSAQNWAQAFAHVGCLGHRQPLIGWAHSPQYCWLAGGAYGAVYLWNSDSGAEVMQLRHSGDKAITQATRCVFSSGNRLAAAAFDDGTIDVWEVATQKLLATFGGHHEEPTTCAFSPDGTRVLSGAGFPDRALRVWEAATGRELLALVAHEGGTMDAAFSADGSRIVSCSTDRMIVWDGVTGAALASRPRMLPEGTVHRFSNDGRLVAIGCMDGALKLWEWQVTGAPARGTHT